MNKKQLKTAKAVIERHYLHYNLNLNLTDSEIHAEIDNLKRRGTDVLFLVGPCELFTALEQAGVMSYKDLGGHP